MTQREACRRSKAMAAVAESSFIFFNHFGLKPSPFYGKETSNRTQNNKKNIYYSKVAMIFSSLGQLSFVFTITQRAILAC
jgi:hypothetical protein